ncbi:MAG: InlB B-repeat-containing protein, partial [Solobacterium sp.]|nr:InlB B-repeat-containing protein [Solobacterium sp.]
MSRKPRKRVLKPNAAKALRISALFGVVFMMAIASVGLFRGQKEPLTEKFIYEELSNAGMTVGEGTITTIEVTTSRTPQEGGTITPSASIPSGTSITLNAVPANGYRFVGWKDESDAYVSYSPSYITPKLSEDAAFVAEFAKQETIEVVPKALMDRDGHLSVDKEGGAVIGGGTLAKGDDLDLVAKPNYPDLYEFKSWYLDRNGSRTVISNDAELCVGYEYVGPDPVDFQLQQGDVLYASFARKEDVTIVTASMIPAIGGVGFFDHQLNQSELDAFSNDETNPGSVANVISLPVTDYYLYFGAYLPDAGNHKAGNDPVRQYTLTHVNYVSSVYGTGYLNTWDPGNDLKAVSFPGGDKLKGDTDIFIHYKGYDSSFNYTCALTTSAFPAEGGVTTGDMASTGSFTGNIRATPNDGYQFDHWEWFDEQTGKLMTSKEASLSVKVAGMVSFKAIFRKRIHTVNVASVTPAAGGYVKTGLGNVEYNAQQTVEIVPYEGYEFQNVNYTTMDGIKHSFDSPVFTLDGIKEDIWLNLVFTQTKFTVSAKPEPVKADGDTGFNKITLSSGDTSITTAEDGDAAELDLNSQASVTLEAFPSLEDGYRFVQWVGTDGSVSTANPYTPSSVSKNVTYIAKFEKAKYKIRVAADPASYGEVYVGADESSLSALSEYEVKNGEDAFIRAEAKEGYRFLFWTNTAGTRLTSADLELLNIRNDETYTAHFAGDAEVTIEATPAGYGEVQMDQNGYVTTSTTYRASIGDSFTLSARPTDNTSYRFEKWVDKDGKTVSEVPEFTVEELKGPETYTAVFVNDKYFIRTVADAANGGTTDVYRKDDVLRDYPQTSLAVNGGDDVVLIAKPNDGYEFLYWTSSTGTKYYEDTLEIDGVENDETFTAHFTGNIEVIVEPSPAGYGQVMFNRSGYVTASSAYHITEGESFTLSARPLDNSSYKFEKWIASDGSEYTDPDLTISDIDSDTTYTAVFVNDKYIIRSIADPVNGGRANVYRLSEPRTHEQTSVAVNGGDSVILIAEPEVGCEFRYWTSSTGAKYYDQELSILAVENDETFTAHF